MIACAVVLVVGGGNEGKCETFGKRLALTGCPLDGSVHSVVIHIVSFLPVVPIGQPVMSLQLGVVVFQLDLDDDFFAAHGNIKTDEPRTLDFSGVRGFLVTNVCIVQRSAA